MNTDYTIAHEFFAEIWRALDGDEAWLDRVAFMARVHCPHRGP